jgi:hypothetical protein
MLNLMAVRVVFAASLSFAVTPAVAQTTQLNGEAASIILPPRTEKMDQDTLGAMAPTIMGFALTRRLAEQPTTAMEPMTAMAAAVMSGEGWMMQGETKDGGFFVADFPIPPDFAAADLPLRCPAKLPTPPNAKGPADCRLVSDQNLRGLEITTSEDGESKSVFRLFARAGRLYEVVYTPSATGQSSTDAAARRALESLRVK